jgi:hypothetical protein
MMNGLFTQIVTVVIAIGIVITYVQPTFGRIADIQNSIAAYQSERQKVAEVNTLLNDLLLVRDSISSSDERAILTYLPNTVDPIVVQRDLERMLTGAGLLPLSILYDDAFAFQPPATEDANPDGESAMPYPYAFSITATGDYTTIKQFLASLPSNQYPLEVHEVSLGREANGLFMFDATIITYGHDPITPRNPFDQSNR